jgi:hypothetical protein
VCVCACMLENIKSLSALIATRHPLSLSLLCIYSTLALTLTCHTHTRIHRLRAKWRRIMENPPPVTSETRPDIVDKKHSYPDEDVLKSKQKEMRQFGSALRAFESDPQFNPLLVVLAHSLTRYGVPPPESEDTQVWRTWYEEVEDKYHVSAYFV